MFLVWGKICPVDSSLQIISDFEWSVFRYLLYTRFKTLPSFELASCRIQNEFYEQNFWRSILPQFWEVFLHRNKPTNCPHDLRDIWELKHKRFWMKNIIADIFV